MEHSFIVFALFLLDNRAIYTVIIVSYLVLAISLSLAELDNMADNAEIMLLDERGEPVMEGEDPVTLKLVGYDGSMYRVTNKGGDARSWLIAPECARLVL